MKFSNKLLIGALTIMSSALFAGSGGYNPNIKLSVAPNQGGNIRATTGVDVVAQLKAKGADSNVIAYAAALKSIQTDYQPAAQMLSDLAVKANSATPSALLGQVQTMQPNLAKGILSFPSASNVQGQPGPNLTYTFTDVAALKEGSISDYHITDAHGIAVPKGSGAIQVGSAAGPTAVKVQPWTKEFPASHK